MKTNISEQSAVWLEAFAEGLARGEAAFGEGHATAIEFAQSFAFVIEAEHIKATSETQMEAADEAKTSWAKAFNRVG